jgi:hypothetical protein
MKRLTIGLAVAMLAFAGCKKDGGGSGEAAGSGSGTAATKPTDPGPGSGSAAGTAAPTSDRPASVTDEIVAIAEKIVTTLEKVSTDVIGTGADCKKMTEAILANVDAVKAIRADSDALKAKHEGDAAMKAWFKAKYEKRAGEAIESMIGHAKKNCENDKAVGEAFAKLDIMKKKEKVEANSGSGSAAPAMKDP